MMFHGEIWDGFKKERPDTANTLTKFIADGGGYHEMIFLQEYHEYQKYERNHEAQQRENP